MVDGEDEVLDRTMDMENATGALHRDRVDAGAYLTRNEQLREKLSAVSESKKCYETAAR